MKTERLEGILNFVQDLSTHSLLVAELDELKRLAKIGEATELAFEFSERDDYLAQVNKTHHGEPIVTGEVWGSTEKLLEWAEANKND